MCRTKHLFCTNISKQTLDDLPSAYGGINWPGGKVLSARHEKEMLAGGPNEAKFSAQLSV